MVSVVVLGRGGSASADEVAQATASLASASSRLQAAEQRLAQLERETSDLQGQLDSMGVNQQQLAAAMAKAEADFRSYAAEAYISGGAESDVIELLSALDTDPISAVDRRVLSSRGADRMANSLTTLEGLRRDTAPKVIELGTALADRRQELADQRDAVTQFRAAEADAERELAQARVTAAQVAQTTTTTVEEPSSTAPHPTSTVTARPSDTRGAASHVVQPATSSPTAVPPTTAAPPTTYPNPLPIGPTEEQWAALRNCESGGDYHIVSASGKYRGAYQFDFGTWNSLGGSGDPAAAGPAEQDYRAKLLYAQRGARPWPVCGRFLS